MQDQCKLENSIVTTVPYQASLPNYIKLDTESGEILWHTASETWIPEDGLYDHLVVKLAEE
jgi:hypothetical protein